MKKTQFMEQLRKGVCSTADAALAQSGRSSKSCPYIEQWIGFYSAQSGDHIERALHKYAPETGRARSAQDYFSIIETRVRQAVATWAATGQITGAPPGLPLIPGVSGSPGAETGPAALGTRDHAVSRAESSSSPSGQKVLAKRSDGNVAGASDVQAVRGRLGRGRALESSVKSRMESAFGQDFSAVSLHTDSTAATLSSELNARAFTIGSDVAFASGEYQPGTLVGDALIAHELAHVVQQHGSSPSVADDQARFEAEADFAAAQVVLGATPAPGRARSGLRLQRCTPSAGGEISPSAFNFEQVTGGGDPNDRSLPWWAACVNIMIARGPQPGLQVCQFEVGFPGIHRLGRTSTGTAQSAAAEAFNECVPTLLRSRSASCKTIADCVQRRMRAQIPGVIINSPCLTKALTPTDFPTRH